jgi:hypothetical protein
MGFRYLRDPLFLFCLLLYFVNRWWLKPMSSHWFLHKYLNDLICIPFWIPIMLFAMRRLGLRKHDNIPLSYEVLIPLIVWSAAFELILPRVEPFAEFAVSDPADIFFYTLGACIAWWFWSYWYREHVPARYAR